MKRSKKGTIKQSDEDYSDLPEVSNYSEDETTVKKLPKTSKFSEAYKIKLSKAKTDPQIKVPDIPSKGRKSISQIEDDLQVKEKN